MIYKQSSKPEYFVKFGNGTQELIKKEKPELSSLFQYTDRPIAVIGPAPSLEDDLKNIPDNAIYYAVNYHFLHNDRFNFEYLSYLDNPDYGVSSPIKKKLYSEFKGTTITIFPEWTDIYCINENPLMCSDSGIFALWIALYLTSGTVYACGMDNRSTNQMYHEWSCVYNPTTEWDSPEIIKYGRWKMLMDTAHDPSRLVIFNEKVREYLSRA